VNSGKWSVKKTGQRNYIGKADEFKDEIFQIS